MNPVLAIFPCELSHSAKSHRCSGRLAHSDLRIALTPDCQSVQGDS
jgi:hypothetical protein